MHHVTLKIGDIRYFLTQAEELTERKAEAGSFDERRANWLKEKYAKFNAGLVHDLVLAKR